MKRLTAFLLVTLLVGCETNPSRPVPPLVESKKKVDIDPRLLKECPEVPKLVDATDKQVIVAIQAWLDEYSACRTNKHKLNDIVRDAFNLKEKDKDGKQ